MRPIDFFERFTGKVVRINTEAHVAYISKDSITPIGDAPPHGFESDIPIFLEGYSGPVISIGTEVSFRVSGLDASAVDVRDTPKTALARLAVGGLTIVAPESHGVAGQSSIFVAFGLAASKTEKVREEMLKGRAVNILVVWWPVGHQRLEQRLLVSLDDQMVSLPFRRHGVNRIFAILVSGPDEHKLNDTFLARSDGSFETTVIGSSEYEIVNEKRNPLLATTALDITIPEDVFAPRPRDWRIVNRVFSTPTRNECEHRRRRIIAYPALVFTSIGSALNWITAFVLALFLAALGMPKAIQVLKEGVPEEVTIDESLFVPQYGRYHIVAPLACSPAILLVLVALAGIMSAASENPLTAWSEIFNTELQGMVFTAFALTPVVVIIEHLCDEFGWWRKESLRQRVDRTVELATTEPTIDLFGARTTPIASLRLLAADFKNTVCRSFAE